MSIYIHIFSEMGNINIRFSNQINEEYGREDKKYFELYLDQSSFFIQKCGWIDRNKSKTNYYSVFEF